MPVTIGNSENGPVDLTNEDVESLIYTEDGGLTVEGQVAHLFLETVDLEDVLNNEAVAETADTYEGEFALVDDQLVERGKKKGKGKKPAFLKKAKADDDEGDEDDDMDVDETVQFEPMTIETYDLAKVTEHIDGDDLYEMFEWFVNTELAEAAGDSLEEQALVQVGQSMLDEKFARGAFRKIRKQGGAGKDIVTRMLLAMLGKEVIDRAKPGKGYMKGDYKKNPAGYSTGTPGGLKKYARHKKKHAAAIAKTSKKTAKMKGKLAAFAKGKKKAAAKKGSKKKTQQAASADFDRPVGPRLDESTSLAGKLVKGMGNVGTK